MEKSVLVRASDEVELSRKTLAVTIAALGKAIEEADSYLINTCMNEVARAMKVKESSSKEQKDDEVRKANNLLPVDFDPRLAQ